VCVSVHTKQIEVFKYLMVVLIGVFFSPFFCIYFEFVWCATRSFRTRRDAFQARTESKCSACLDAKWEPKARRNEWNGMEHCSHHTVVASWGCLLLLQVNNMCRSFLFRVALVAPNLSEQEIERERQSHGVWAQKMLAMSLPIAFGFPLVEALY